MRLGPDVLALKTRLGLSDWQQGCIKADKSSAFR